MATWKVDDTVLIGSYKKDKIKFGKEVRVVVFDVDHTVIKPKDGKRFANFSDSSDYEFIGQVKKVIKELSKNNVIMMVTNQAGLNGDKRIKAFQTKMDKVFKEIGVPVILYGALKKDTFRKPNTGIVEHHIVPTLKDAGVETIKAFTYIGDAAGRANDFSDGDRKWLYNAKLYLQTLETPAFSGKAYFKTPEEMFFSPKSKNYKKNEPFQFSGINPKSILDDALSLKGKKIKIGELDTSIDYLKPPKSGVQEVILTVGPPAAGKSGIARQITQEWNNYTSTSQDENNGSKPKTIKQMVNFLEQGKSVIVDNTFGNPKARKEYIEAAQKYFKSKKLPIHIRAFKLLGDWSEQKIRNFADHMNMVRMRMGGVYIPAVAYNVYYKNYEKPDETEGFTEIVNTKFLPRFTGPEHVLAFLQRS